MSLYLKLFLIVFLSLVFLGFNRHQESDIHIFKIDSAIQDVASKKISYKNGINARRNYFYSDIYVESFQNNKLIGTEVDTQNTAYRGIYYWKSDTLSLSVFYGDIGTVGFSVDILKDTSGSFFFEQCGHSHNKIKAQPSDTFSLCGKIPCNYSELIISKMPDKTRNDTIFGYANFKSKDFYYLGMDNVKLRKNMKIYFCAGFDFYRKKK